MLLKWGLTEAGDDEGKEVICFGRLHLYSDGQLVIGVLYDHLDDRVNYLLGEL